MTKILNSALKIKGGGREGGTCEVLRPCHPPKIWNMHQTGMFLGVPLCIFVVSGPITIKFCTSIDHQSLSSKMKKFV